jgi:hypothetical protein
VENVVTKCVKITEQILNGTVTESEIDDEAELDELTDSLDCIKVEMNIKDEENQSDNPSKSITTSSKTNAGSDKHDSHPNTIILPTFLKSATVLDLTYMASTTVKLYEQTCAYRSPQTRIKWVIEHVMKQTLYSFCSESIQNLLLSIFRVLGDSYAIIEMVISATSSESENSPWVADIRCAEINFRAIAKEWRAVHNDEFLSLNIPQIPKRNSSQASLNDTYQESLPDNIKRSRHQSSNNLASLAYSDESSEAINLTSLYKFIKKCIATIDPDVAVCRGNVKMSVVGPNSSDLDILVQVPAIIFQPSNGKKLDETKSNQTCITARVTKSASGSSKSETVTPSPLDISYWSKQQTSIRALVVDDSIVIQKALKRLLESKGCTVDIAVNGKQGLRMLQSANFDVAFVDFLMVIHVMNSVSNSTYLFLYYSFTFVYVLVTVAGNVRSRSYARIS